MKLREVIKSSQTTPLERNRKEIVKKKIGIKNLKYCDWASEETNCFSATVTVDDEDFCTAQDEGRGGSIQFKPIKDYNYEPIEKLDLWCISNLPKWSVKGLDKPLDTTLEIAVGELVEDRIEKGRYWKDYDNRIKMSGDNPIGENDN